MSERKLQVGDIVKLLSGGPNMTVQNTSEDEDGEMAFCKWFEGSKIMGDSFPVDTLEFVQ
jgi:uncharacterized protein YodC (DUF2158 family)